MEAAARLVLGSDPCDAALIHDRSLGGALDGALLDLRGQVEGRSVAAILGAQRADVAVNGLLALGNDTVERDAAAAASLVAAGYRTIKLKRPFDGRGIEASLGAVRDAVGPRVALRLDLNGELDESEAIEWLRTLASLDLEYVEQPIAPAGGVAALARVRRAIPMPLAADESVADLDAASSLLAAEACDVLVIKPSRVGGPRVAVAIAHVAEQAGVGATISTLYESGIGLTTALHVAAALSGDGAHGLSTGELLISDLVGPVPRVVGGRLSLADRCRARGDARPGGARRCDRARRCDGRRMIDPLAGDGGDASRRVGAR